MNVIHSAWVPAVPWDRPSFCVVCPGLACREGGRRQKTIVLTDPLYGGLNHPTVLSLPARSGVKWRAK
jgi:hypothetical protein